MWWEHFNSESEAFSLWIDEKEKELQAVSSISSLESLDKHINTMEVRTLSHSSHIFDIHVIPPPPNRHSCDECALYRLHKL